MEDKTLICVDCKNEFVFSAGEQQFFKTKNLLNTPKRCVNCRAEYKKRHGLTTNPRPQRQMFEAECSRCGGVAILPFFPRLDRPIYCSTCLDVVREETRHGGTGVSSAA